MFRGVVLYGLLTFLVAALPSIVEPKELTWRTFVSALLAGLIAIKALFTNPNDHSGTKTNDEAR